jgi:hypothetical protein
MRGLTLYLRCPLCEHLGKLEVRRRDEPHEDYSYWVHCWSCSDGDQKSPPEWLGELAKALGCRKGDLLTNPLPWVAHLERGTVKNGSAPPPTRSLVARDGTLDPGVMAHLADELARPEYEWPRSWLARRGIPEHIWKRAGLGWLADYGFLVIPYSDGLFKTRSPRDGAPTFNMPGWNRPWPLYIVNPKRLLYRSWVLLLEGETDTLRAEAAALPAAGLPNGVVSWHDRWARQLSYLGVERVFVCLDVGAEHRAEHVAERLALWGGGSITPQIVDLRGLPFGLTKKNADLSDYLNNGGSRRELLAALATGQAEE